MNRRQCACVGAVGDGGGGAQRAAPSPRWACPFFKFDPILHQACGSLKARGASDVRSHIRRRHPGEAEKMTKKGDGSRHKTNQDGWYAMWSDFFPAMTPPATPLYTGTEFADLSDVLMGQYIERQQEQGCEASLMGYLDYVREATSEMRSGPMSSPGDADVSRFQDMTVHDDTHQDASMATNLSVPNMGPVEPLVSSQLLDPGLHFVTSCETNAWGVATASQLQPIRFDNSQTCIPPAISERYYHPTPSSHFEAVRAGVANERDEYPFGSSEDAGEMGWTRRMPCYEISAEVGNTTSGSVVECERRWSRA